MDWKHVNAEITVFRGHNDLSKLFKLSDPAINEILFCEHKDRFSGKVVITKQLFELLKNRGREKIIDYVRLAHDRVITFADLDDLFKFCKTSATSAEIADFIRSSLIRPYSMMTIISKYLGELTFNLMPGNIVQLKDQVWKNGN